MSKTTDKVTTFSVANATNSAVDLSVSNQFDYGISAEYQRSNYDSPTARKDFLDSQFQDSKTTISKDGQTVHRSHEAAKNKYGAKRASYHQAEADHKDPLKNIQERTEKNPVLRSLLTDQDIEEVGNRTGNFQVLSKRENASKGAQSEIQRGMETRDVKRVLEGAQTQAQTDLLLAERAAKNAAVAVGTVAANAAADAVNTGAQTALVALTVSGLNNLAYIASGEKDLETALKDVANDTSASFVSGTGARLLQDVTAGTAKICGADQLANFIAKDFPAAEIALAAMTINTVKQYLDGQISAEDCAFYILRNGAGTLAYQLGFVISGGPAGAIIASVVVTQISNAITEYRQERKLQKDRDAELDRLLSDARAEIARQHDSLQGFVQAELGRWDQAIDKGFRQIISSALENNNDGITAGLNTVLGLFGTHARYQTTEEYKRDFFSEGFVLTL